MTNITNILKFIDGNKVEWQMIRESLPSTVMEVFTVDSSCRFSLDEDKSIQTYTLYKRNGIVPERLLKLPIQSTIIIFK